MNVHNRIESGYYKSVRRPARNLWEIIRWRPVEELTDTFLAAENLLFAESNDPVRTKNTFAKIPYCLI